ncbi:unnamed protein product [Auanema sp. JU1783]|nr:unnamed protein product [Auanema sp. JU1783]
MKYHLIILLLPIVSSICPDTASCINRIREIVAGPKKFWFGEQRRALCHHRNANPIDCFGPAHLASFHSLGSRLFRVKTYHSAYLRNLELFPRISYRNHPGHYRACEHNFHTNSSSPIESDPDMTPVEPFSIRHKPEIGWHGLQYDDEYILLMTDVGFGTLNYLVADFPKKPKILKDYEPSENFRPLANPLVLLVFKKGKAEIISEGADEFNLAHFMMKNGLEDNLVGMNIVVVGSDPFAIERQRVRGNVDNCHSLLMPRLHRQPPTRLISNLPLNEISQWISVSFESPKLDVNVCCQKIRQKESTVFIDPIGDEAISASATLRPPTFTSLRISTASANYMNYHRQARTYVALIDDLYTLVIIDGDTGKLHWMLVDIPAAELGTEQIKGITKAKYHPLTPTDPASCRIYLIALFQQTDSLQKLDNYCNEDCRQRKEFKIDTFKQQHGLRLNALSWLKSCYDLPYAFHVLKNEHISLMEKKKDR